MAWISRNRFAVLAYAILFLPALVIPAFVHQQQAMKGWIYFAWIFCCPLAAFVGSLKKKRNLFFYLGLVSLLTPIDIIWYLAYISIFVPPPREKVAELYIPIITLSGMFLLPLGFYLTYISTHSRGSSDA